MIRGRAAIVAVALSIVLVLGAVAWSSRGLLRSWTSPQGSLVVALSAGSPVRPGGSLAIHARGGGWTHLARVVRRVPKAPGFLTAFQGSVPAGTYDRVRLGSRTAGADIAVAAGKTQQVLLAVNAAGLVPDGVYSDTQAFNLGLNELSGKVPAMPVFHLVDQHGRPFDNATIAGREVVIAPFLTSCQETCPIYTGLFLQLRKELPSSVILAEVTIDPWDDTPQRLRAYAAGIGAGWTFATADPATLAAFWQHFHVPLSRGDVHQSELMLIDGHGFIRHGYAGVPHVGSGLPASLMGQLDAEGRSTLAAGGDGWGAPQVLDAVQTMQRLATPSSTAGGEVPSFALPGPNGRSDGPQNYRGHPLVVDFWASWCVPCHQELPLLQRAAASHPGLRVLLVDERDNRSTATGYLSRLGIRLPTVFDGSGQVGDVYRIVGLPTTVFVRPDGTVEGRLTGQVGQASLASHLSDLGR